MDNSINFIGLSVKQNIDFKKHLASLAASDTKHDFDVKFVMNEYYPQGIPNRPMKVMYEADSLNSVISSLTTRVNFLDTFEIGTPKGFSVKFGLDNPTIIHNYTGEKFPIDKKTFDAKYFAEKNQLKNAILVVDFNQHGFLSLLKQGGTTDLAINLFYVLTPEIINDPAPKTPATDSLFKKNGGINLIPCVESNSENTSRSYTSYDDTNISTNNNFFSNYNFQLNPLEKVKKLGGLIETIESSIVITSDAKNGVVETTTIKDSKKENSKVTLLKYLEKLLMKMITLLSNMLSMLKMIISSMI